MPRIFIVGAIVLIVFAIIASAAASGLFLGTAAIIWFYASFLSFLVDILLGWGWPAFTGRNRDQNVPQA